MEILRAPKLISIGPKLSFCAAFLDECSKDPANVWKRSENRQKSAKIWRKIQQKSVKNREKSIGSNAAKLHLSSAKTGT